MRRNQRLSFVPPSLLLATLLIISPHSTSSSGGVDIPCQWASLMGASYNLQPLTKPLQGSTAGSCSYSIFDGDIPCTPAIEPSYNYVWNMCADVGTIDVPNACKKMAKSGVALQYVDLGNDAYNCLVIGKYDPSQDDLYFSLIDSSNPAKGVSMRYPQGEKCGTADKTGAIMRSATIDVKCANTPLKIVSAQEPTLCSYHLVMESYYGCPTECPITSNGLCNSHGHCHYDNILEAPYCYCNQGYKGASCSEIDTSSSAPQPTSLAYRVQLGLLITLLIIAIALVAVVGFMIFRITQFRKEQVDSSLDASMSGTEMIETVKF